MTVCITGNLDTSYLASPNFMVFSFHVVTAITIPILIFGAYCILAKTPVTMKPVRFLLLNLHIWGALNDITICFLAVPYVHLPALAGYGLGAVDAPALLTYCGITFFLALTVAILSIYENRYYVLFGQSNRWKRFRKPYLMSVYTATFLVFIPPYLNLPEQDSARKIVLSNIPCLPEFTYSTRKMFVLALDPTVSFICITSCFIFLSASLLCFFVLFWYNLTQKVNVHSSQTLALQKKFLIVLNTQSALVIFFVTFPVLTIILLIATRYHNQKLTNLTCLTMSFHGAGSTIVMILVHKPYRDYVFSKIPCVGNWLAKSETVTSDSKLNRSKNVNIIL